MKDKVFIDSNILLYAFDCKNIEKQIISKKIALRLNATISTQVVNEVSNNLLKKFSFNDNQTKQFINSCYKRYTILNLNQEVFLIACDIRDNYNISYYDSLIVSSAIDSKCNILYSEDMQHNQKIDQLTIINPFRLKAYIEV